MRLSEMVLKEKKQKNVLDLFKEVYRIYKSLSGRMFVVFFSSWIIFIGDPLHTAIVEQYKNKENISLSEAFSKAKKYLGSYTLVEIFFSGIIIGNIVLIGLLIAFLILILGLSSWLALFFVFMIMIIGIVNIFYHAFYASMVSNVVILENKTGIKAIKRCRQLVRQNRNTEALCASYLLGIPFVAGVFWVFISYLFEKAGLASSNVLTVFYVVITFILIIITLSVLELGNTLLYYKLVEREKAIKNS